MKKLYYASQGKTQISVSDFECVATLGDVTGFTDGDLASTVKKEAY